MLKLEIDDKTIWAVAGRTAKSKDALLRSSDEFGKERKASIQLIDADKVFGTDHLHSALEKAVRAFKSGENVSDTLVTEMMLYLSGCRQIHEALDSIGLREGSEKIVILIDKDVRDLPAQFSLKEDDSVLSPKGKDIRYMGITDVEAATARENRRIDLVLERVASVDIKKK